MVLSSAFFCNVYICSFKFISHLLKVLSKCILSHFTFPVFVLFPLQWCLAYRDWFHLSLVNLACLVYLNPLSLSVGCAHVPGAPCAFGFSCTFRPTAWFKPKFNKPATLALKRIWRAVISRGSLALYHITSSVSCFTEHVLVVQP